MWREDGTHHALCVGERAAAERLDTQVSSRVRDLLACPRCHGMLTWSTDASRCETCPAIYPIDNGIPIFLSGDEDELKQRQAAWFDDGADAEYEITRPSRHATVPPVAARRSSGAASPRSAASYPDRRPLGVCGVGHGRRVPGTRRSARDRSRPIARGSPASARARKAVGVAIDPIVADVERLPFADRSIDLVYVHDGLHHLAHPLTGLAEMARVARRAVSVTEPARAAVTRLSVLAGISGDVEEAGNRVERIEPTTLADKLRRDGFEVVRLSATRCSTGTCRDAARACCHGPRSSRLRSMPFGQATRSSARSATR